MGTILSSVPALLGDAGWFPRLAELLARGTALLLLVFAVAAVLRRASASTRHLIWSIGLMGVLLLPLLSTALPWRLEVLPGAATVLAARKAVPATGAVERDGAEAGAVEAATPAAWSGAPPAVAPDAESAAAAAAAPAAAASRSSEVLAPGWSWPSRVTILLVLAALWGAGAILFLGQMAAGAALVWRIARRGTPLEESPAWVRPLWEAADRLDLERLPRLVRSDDVTLPFACGLVRPMIVLPASAEEWSDERRRAVLFHELGHVRRHDLLSHLVGRLACALYWFHPLVWLAARRARAESERACDDLVIATGTRASTYADHLLQIVCGAARTSAPAVAIPMAQRKEFEGRMLAILEPGVRREAPTRLQSAVIASSVAVLALAVAVVAPARGRAAVPGGERQAAVPDDVPPFPTTEADRAPERAEPVPANTAPVREPPLPPGGDLVAEADTHRVRRRGYAYSYSYGTNGEVVVQSAGDALGNGFQVTVAVPQPMPMPMPMPTPLVWGGQGPKAAGPNVRVKASGEAEADAKAVAALIEALRDPVADVRRSAVHALGELDDPEAVAALSEVLRKDEDAEVRKMAAWALGEIEDPAAIPALGEAVRGDRSAEVRKMAAWALGEIGDPGAVEALGAGARDASPDVAKMAVWALGEIEDPRAAAPLAAALRHEDADVRAMAVWAFGELEDPQAAPGLVAALQDRTAGVRSKAAWALGELGLAQAPEALIQALKDSDADVRRTAAWALGEVADPAAVPALKAAFSDANANVRRTALWALGEIGGPAAYEALLEAIKSEDPELRKRAVQALGRSH